MPRRVFISADHGLAVVYFLQSDVVPSLLNAGIEIVVLTDDETKALGKNIQNINIALCEYWSTRFPKDPIEKLYVVCFHESEEYHIHIHLIPRTKELGGEDPTENMAWKTFKRTEKDSFPQEYRIMIKDPSGSLIEDQKVEDLMSYLKGT